MGACNDLWMTEVEQLGDDLTAGKIDVGEFRRWMKNLGFDPHEIDDHLDALEIEWR